LPDNLAGRGEFPTQELFDNFFIAPLVIDTDRQSNPESRASGNIPPGPRGGQVFLLLDSVFIRFDFVRIGGEFSSWHESFLKLSF
jgi:hypothetical protein